MKFIELFLSLDPIYDLNTVAAFCEIRREGRGEEATRLRATARGVKKVRHIDLVKLGALDLLSQAFRSVFEILITVGPRGEAKQEAGYDRTCQS